MGLIALIIILILLFGGGGFYMGPPYHYYGGGLGLFLLIVLLAHQAWLMVDAIGRTLVRLLVTRRNLLQWVTAAQANLSSRLDLGGAYRRMSGGVAIAVAAAVLVEWLRPDA